MPFNGPRAGQHQKAVEVIHCHLSSLLQLKPFITLVVICRLLQRKPLITLVAQQPSVPDHSWAVLEASKDALFPFYLEEQILQ